MKSTTWKKCCPKLLLLRIQMAIEHKQKAARPKPCDVDDDYDDGIEPNKPTI